MSDACPPLLSELLAPTDRRAFLTRASALGAVIGGSALVGCREEAGEKGATQGGATTGARPARAAAGAATQQNPDSRLDTLHGTAGHTGSSATGAGGQPVPYRRYDPTLPPLSTERTLRLHWTAREVPLHITRDTVVAAWTFEGDIPGPIVHCRVGDTIEFTLTNEGKIPHSMDFHAAQIDPKTAFRSAAPGQSVTYTFKPRYAGAFLYHCGTAPVLMHIGSGMYGAIIVSPPLALPAAKEFVLVQGEYYLEEPVNGVRPFDYTKMLGTLPDFVTFNGRPSQYQTDPIRVKVGDRVRFWVVNAGPTAPCAFHVVGEQFDTVYLGSPPGNSIRGVQTFDVPAGGGMVFELVCDIPGEFPFVNHGFGHGQKGAIGFLVVEQ